MYFARVVLIYKLFWLTISYSEMVRIGISKPLPITSPMPPTTNEIGTTTEEIIEDTAASDVTEYLAVTMKATTLSDTEWPDFPPKKSLKTSNKTTTGQPSATTGKPTTTTTTATTNMSQEKNITHDQATGSISFPKWPATQKYCFCDLTKEYCDMNCCCDHDCPPQAFKVFRCQQEASIGLDPNEGRFEDFKFQHGLPSCDVNDGWLCVFRTNRQIEVPKNEGASYLEDTSRFYKWPNLLLESEDVKQREFYKYGDLLRIINIETKDIQNFDLPSSFESSSCRIREPIYYLRRVKKSCLISSYESLRETKLKLLQLKENYKIFNTPIIPDDIYNNKYLENFVENITIRKCLKTKNNCSDYEQNKQDEEIYAVFKVKVNILHNFTHIHGVVVDLWLDDMKEVKNLASFEQDYWLHYETEFFNETLRGFKAAESSVFYKPPIVSGPLGYLQGKPLIVARYEPFNRSQPLSTRNQVLSYFSPNTTEPHTLSMLAKENGICKRTKSSNDYISYGINAAYYCKVKLKNNSVVEKSTNFTEKCLNLQQSIHDQLFGRDLIIENLSSHFISQLGKPQNNSKKWLQLQVYNTGIDVVLGQHLHETNTFICRNILLSLSYEFHMATFTVENTPLQSVITRAILHLDERHDLEFSLNESLEVPVTVTVRFYNVLEKAASASGSTLPKIILIFCFLKCSLLIFFVL